MTSTTTNTNPKVIKLHELIYRISSQTTKGKFYSVIVKDKMPTSCNCEAFNYHKKIVCSHMYRVKESIDYETFIDATEQKERLTTIPEHVGMDDEYTV